MKIQVLGSGCSTCKTLYKNVQDVIAKLGLDMEVEYSTDIAEIVRLGAMGSPVFAIEEKVMSAGKVPSNEEIENMILSESKDKNSYCYDEEKPESGCSCGGNC